ncbi:NAD(P)H-dependent oxidoreductase [Labrenzia sp. PHM005]|uniref:NAD(P)H-dependent oxidoreductase n=1 Tax=Labrenzia sp. PHM005 TaxID=2590016 RepID=UPI00113FFBE2|nr:NAD(P)H-dependent oxidoreductase [Labrenzia sp. PHM005]QDG75699.1 NAD(P)H-dependent oxidoreductase [Labrenzia sp. PHM005]
MTTPKQIVVLDGHPDPNTHHLCHALAAHYEEGASRAGHKANLIRIADLDFPVLQKPSEFQDQPTPTALEPARDLILAADHVVLVYPLWLGTLPAYTKAFLEQIFHYDTAFEKGPDNAWPEGKMKGKSARIIVTMGMPALVYRFWYGAHSLKNLERNIFRFIGFAPVRSTLLGMVEQANEKTVSGWLKKMEDLGRKSA